MIRVVASQGHKSEPIDLQLLTDSLPALIHTGLPDGYVDFFNQRSLEYVGLPLEALQGWKWTAAISSRRPGRSRGKLACIVSQWRALPL